ncbi:MAG: hypothetical protein E7390_08635 [Ruminococcaceae bacterium]|nr:hypothetical protein [Oscillospiraceae bacterium]
MGDQLIHEVQTGRTDENTQQDNRQSRYAALLRRRKNQAKDRSGQHDAGSKRKYNVMECVGYFFEQKANNGTNKGCTADTDGG